MRHSRKAAEPSSLTMPEKDADVFEVLVGQMRERSSADIPFSEKRCAYCPRPSFSSQSATCCIRQRPRLAALSAHIRKPTRETLTSNCGAKAVGAPSLSMPLPVLGEGPPCARAEGRTLQVVPADSQPAAAA